MSSAGLSPDPRLSRYVVAVQRGGGEAALYNTMTRALLPAEAGEERLETALFLAGQEQAALEQRLFGDRRLLTLTLIVTWECNLRCSHCTVLPRLVERQRQDIDPEKLAGFVERFRQARPSIDTLKLTLLGGEPLLRPDLCLELLRRARPLAPKLGVDATTNLAMPLGQSHFELVAELDDLVVSLDGLEQLHNAQRKPWRAEFNPFRRTMDNLERLVERGYAEKLLVQGAIRDEFARLENFQDFQRELMRIGVPWNRIRFETIHPTELRPRPQQSYLETLRRRPLREEPCCKYRGGHKLIVDHDGTLYSDYYDWVRLGTLDDEVPALLENHQRMVRETMPALRDETCRACPVLAYCWGGCTNAHQFHREPSRHCDQQELIGRVRRLADEGELTDGQPETGCLS